MQSMESSLRSAPLSPAAPARPTRTPSDRGVICGTTGLEGLVEVEFERIIRTTWPQAEAQAEAGAPVEVPEGLLAQLALFDALVDAITSAHPGDVPGAVAAEASARVHRGMDRLQAQRSGWIARVESEGLWGLETMHSFTSWLASAENLSPSLARRTVATARALRDHLPVTAAQARAGTVTDEHVTIMVRTASTDAIREALRAPVTLDAPAPSATFAQELAVDGEGSDDAVPASEPRVGSGEEMLLGLATGRHFSDFTRVAKYFAAVCDPDAQDRAFTDAAAKEFLQLSPTIDGVQISGFLTTEHGQLVATALRAVTGVPSSDDVQPLSVGRARACPDLAQLFLDGGLAGKGANVRPHLSVIVTWDQFTDLYASRAPASTGSAAEGTVASRTDDNSDPGGQWSPQILEAQLRAGPPTWEDGTGPIPDQVLRRIACDSDITRVIFGPDSQILNIGRTQRTFTKEHRRAVVARDRHCVWPGCEAPPHVCEVHHAVRHWADGGETTPSNGALLCRFHHHRVDGENIAMTFVNGWTFDLPDTYRTDEPGNAPADLGASPGAERRDSR